MLFITCWGRWKWNWNWELDGIAVKCTINFLEAGELNWTQLVFLSVVSTDCTQTPLSKCVSQTQGNYGRTSPSVCPDHEPVTCPFFGRNDAKAETPVLWPPHANSWLIGKRLWCWEGLGAGGEGDDRGWDGWMASLTQWTWIWVNSGSWWWTGRPGVLQFMGLQRVGHDWVTELNWMTYKDFPGALVVKNPPANAKYTGSIPG